MALQAGLWAAAARAPAVLPLPPAPETRPLRLCVVTPGTGDTGTACAAIAELWREAGHEVTLLHARGEARDESPEAEPAAPWAERCRARGIAVVACPPAQRLSVPPPLQLGWNVWAWLRDRRFDLVYLPEWKGCGHYALAARRLGTGLRDTRILVGTQAPTLWLAEGNQRLPRSAECLVADAAERMAVAAADAVVSPSRAMLDWLGGNGWALPAACHMVPNPAPAATHAAPRPSPPAAMPVGELVFFGRLEPRTGLILFLQALRRLDPALLAGRRVTFLGEPGDMPGGAPETIAAARPEGAGIAAWGTLAGLDGAQALAYLAGPGRLAVMPSLAGNAPMTVLECLHGGIPFVATRAGGIPGMLAEEDRRRHLCEATPAALAETLARALREGPPSPARPAVLPEVVAESWRRLAAAYGSAPPAPGAGAAEGPAAAPPLVSVVLVTRNRPGLLAQALDGLRAQTWPALEVVLVDDGSDQAEAIAALDALAPEFAARGWRILRQPNRYLGAARNAGWRLSRGRYVVFHDDDNVSLPHLVETYVRAAGHSGADILTATMAVFHGTAPPPGEVAGAAELFAPLGGTVGAGLFHNLFGDAQACFRREVLEELGGFTEDHGVGHEDWELFARAALRGFTLLSVPEPLYWYRISGTSMLRTRSGPDADLLRSARPYLALLPPQLRPALLHAIAAAHRDPPPAGRAVLLLRNAAERARRLAAAPAIGPLLRLGWRAARPLLQAALARPGAGKS
jgi:GT2 family glycosyltransferase